MSIVINRESIFMQIKNQIGHTDVCIKITAVNTTDHIQNLFGIEMVSNKCLLMDQINQRANKEKIC